MRRARDLDRLQVRVTPDTVLDMRDQIAGRERGCFREEILRAPDAAAGTHHAVADDVLLADDREVRTLEPVFESQDREPNGALMQGLGFSDVGDALERADAVIGENAAHAIGGALAPAGDDDAL